MIKKVSVAASIISLTVLFTACGEKSSEAKVVAPVLKAEKKWLKMKYKKR